MPEQENASQNGQQGTGFQLANSGTAPKSTGSPSLKDQLKKLKESFKGKFAEGDENEKKIGEMLDKMNFDEDKEEEVESESGNEDIPELQDPAKESSESSEEPMEKIQAILPQLDQEKLQMAVNLLTAILEGKDPQMEMKEKKELSKPMCQEKASQNPVRNAPAKFSESKRIPAWMKIQMEEQDRTTKELREELVALKNEKKARTELAVFQEEMKVALKNHPHQEQLHNSFTQVFSEKGLKDARDTMKTVLGIASKVPLANATKLPKRLTENMSQAHPEQIPELKKYAGDPAHLKKAMEFAEIHRSRTNNTMSLEKYVDNGMKAEFAELRGEIRGTVTFNENDK